MMMAIKIKWQIFSQILLWQLMILHNLYNMNIFCWLSHYLNHWHFVNSLRLSDAYMRRQINHNWFRQWLVAWTTPSHYLNQCWNIINWALGNKLQWNFNRNSNIFIEENTFENVVCEMLFISSWPQCVNEIHSQGASEVNRKWLLLLLLAWMAVE